MCGLGGIYTTMLLMITVTLVFVFYEKVQHLHEVAFYQRKLIMHVECGHVFGKHSKFSTMRCRKCNFVLIDIEVRILLTFLVGMTAMARLYQSMYLFFRVYTHEKMAFSSTHF